MSKKDFMRWNTGAVANAELLLIAELNRRGIFEFDTQRGLLLECCDVSWTIPDFYFAKANLAVYLDGDAVHNKRRVEERDEAIDKALGRRGVGVLRFPYTAPVSKQRLKEIADAEEEALKRGSEEAKS